LAVIYVIMVKNALVEKNPASSAGGSLTV